MDLIDNENIDIFLKNKMFTNLLEYIDSIYNLKENIYDPICINSDSSFITRKFIFILKQKLNKNIGKNLKINEHKLNSNKNLVFTTKTSSHHIEINPSEHGIYDKNIINEYLYDISSSPNVITSKKKNIIIWSIDNLGQVAQECLQNLILEKKECANFICTCSNENKLSPSLKSILNIINIKTNKNMFNNYYEKHLKNKIEEKNYKIILENSKIIPNRYDVGLFFHKLFQLENNCDFQSVSFFHNHVNKFYEKLKKVKKIDVNFCEFLRDNLYEYYVNHISSSDILKLLLELIINDSDLEENFKEKICESVIKYNINSSKGNKNVIHLEAFILDFLYKMIKYN